GQRSGSVPTARTPDGPLKRRRRGGRLHPRRGGRGQDGCDDDASAVWPDALEEHLRQDRHEDPGAARAPAALQRSPGHLTSVIASDSLPVQADLYSPPQLQLNDSSEQAEQQQIEKFRRLSVTPDYARAEAERACAVGLVIRRRYRFCDVLQHDDQIP